MAETFDIAIVGAGITGCAIARQLARYDLSICVVEAANDIALGASKANGGLAHAGYDPAPGTVKAQVNARGCELYGTWAQELGFLFCRTGSMVLGFNDEDRAHLEKLRRNGLANGVPELSIVGPDRIRELEPRASADATCALWCPSTGFVDPFEVAIAALENAVANGVTFMRSASVEAIEVAGSGDDAHFTLATPAGNVRCRYLINAAGSGAADISHMAGAEEFQMVWRQGNIVVLDKEPRTLMPLYPVPTPVSKGVIVTGTVHGNTVITATADVREPGDTQTYASDVNALLTGARKLVPDLDTRRVVRAFAGGRPVIQETNDFFIGQSAVVPELFQASGIQSPGVASAPAIAERMEQVLRDAGVPLRERDDWDPIRRAPDDFDRVLKCGADKVSVNSGALRDPDLIPAAARRYGNQCVVLSADVKRVNGQFRVFAKGGREDTGRDALDWIRWCVDHGAGEICLNSIDTDGVRNGFDLEMLDAVAARVNIPIIASGGAGKKEDFLELFHHKGIDAGLAAGIFHQKLLGIRELKEYLNASGVEMRL